MFGVGKKARGGCDGWGGRSLYTWIDEGFWVRGGGTDSCTTVMVFLHNVSSSIGVLGGVLDGSPRGGQDVAEQHGLLIRHSLGHLEHVHVRCKQRHPVYGFETWGIKKWGLGHREKPSSTLSMFTSAANSGTRFRD